MLLHCQQCAKAEASRPPKSASPCATSQPALAVVDTVFLESFYTANCASTAALPSAVAASGCAQCMHSLGLSPPCRTCRCFICGHLPSLALLLILCSPTNNRDTLWRRSLPCHQPPLGARAAQLPHPRPAWLLCQLCPTPGRGTNAVCPWPLCWCWLWPSERQSGKRQGGGSKQGLSTFPRACKYCVGLSQRAAPHPQCIFPGTFI